MLANTPGKANNTAAKAVAEHESTQPPRPPLEALDPFVMLTFLLRLVVILGNGDGDASLHGYAEDMFTMLDNEDFSVCDADLRPLDAVSAILVQEHEVIAACYQSTNGSNLTVVGNPPVGTERRPDIEHRPDSERRPDSEHQPDQPDTEPYLDIPPSPSDSEVLTMPLTITALANPDRRTNSSGQGGNPKYHSLRFVSQGHDYWPKIKNNSLDCITK